MDRQRRARRIYRAMLAAFPPTFRRAFGRDMAEVFCARLSDEGRTAGQRARIWAEAMADVAVHAPREWVRAAGQGTRVLLREGTTMEGWIQDLRIGIRGLARRPAFTGAAAGTLALGIGAVVALFSVVDSVLLTPLPYPDSDRLVVVWKVNQERGSRGNSVDHPDVRAWQQAYPDFLVSGYAGTRPTLTGLGDPEVVEGVRVTDGLLEVFGVSPALGRDLTAADDVPDGPRRVVVSWGFWQGRLGGDPDVLGTSLTLGGQPWEIVGVAPRSFGFPDGVDLWLPRRHDVEGCGHGCNIMNAVGRLPADATLESVVARLRPVDARLAEEHPDSHRDVVIDLQSMHEYLVEDVEAAMWILLAAVGMVLLIACANVANLMMVRGSERTGEMAVRAALGAGRVRIGRQLLAEALVLAGAAAAVGLVLAAWGVSVLSSMAPPELPRMSEVGLDGRTVLFTVALAGAVAVVFGMLPARQAVRTSLMASLGSAGRTGGRRGGGRSRGLLLAGEVALSLTLLLGAGLLFRTLQEMRSVDLGFDAAHVERFRLSTPDSRYDTEGALALFDDLDRRIAALPGVTAVGHGFGMPFASGSISTSTSFPDRPPVDPADQPNSVLRTASPGLLDALGMRLVSGRWIEASDRHGETPVAVINETAARTYFPEGDAIGRPIELSVSWGFAEEPPRRVVGVVADVRTRSPTLPDEPTVYVPNAQLGADVAFVTIRRAPGAPSVIPAAREVLAALDPEIAITSVEQVSDAVARAGAPTRFYLTLLSVFSALALLLAAVGLYGVVAFAVSRRAREIGIRRALGARSRDVTGMAMRQGLGPAAAGVALGLVGAWFTSRALESMLFGVPPYDLPTLAAVTALLLAVVALATALPARRASRIAPAEALRDE